MKESKSNIVAEAAHIKGLPVVEHKLPKPFQIYLVDHGFARIIYKCKNPNNETIYYAICQESFTRFTIYRLCQKLEAQGLCHAKQPLVDLFELPEVRGTMLERDIHYYILTNGGNDELSNMQQPPSEPDA